jgi:hypothetical protein
MASTRPARGRIGGPARATKRVGQIAIPVTTERGDTVTVLIARSQIRRFIAQLQRAEVSADRIKEIRHSSH